MSLKADDLRILHLLLQFHAMNILHRYGYDISAALASMVPMSGPVLCRDEMEEWSASEANLFEEALEKYGKDFNDIRADFVSTGGMRAGALELREGRKVRQRSQMAMETVVQKYGTRSHWVKYLPNCTNGPVTT